MILGHIDEREVFTFVSEIYN